MHPDSQTHNGRHAVAQCIELNPTPYTLHPTGEVHSTKPYTLHPTPYTLHPTPYTLHPTNLTHERTTAGTLWRSAYQLDAAGLFVIGSRYKPESTDVVKARQKIPLIQYPDWNTFCAAAPYDAKWVGASCVCVCVCLCVCVWCVCARCIIYTRACIHASILAYTRARARTHTHTHTHTYTHSDRDGRRAIRNIPTPRTCRLHPGQRGQWPSFLCGNLLVSVYITN